jgi:UDP-N-acetylglucosamine 3-dehydrogenase
VLSENHEIRVGVIGAGNMGRYHVRNYSELKGVKLVAIADINPEVKHLADSYEAKHFIDYREMIDKCDLDAVSIVVPTPLHLEVASYAMNNNLHVMLEKPIASTAAEADQLIKLAKAKKIVFTVGHIEHYNPLIRAVKEIVDKGELGDISSVICRRVGVFPSSEPSTDVVVDLAVHDLGIINYVTGRRPKNIYSHGSRTHHSHKIDSAEILVDYGDMSGFAIANWITPVKIRSISITGSKGYIEGNYITQKLDSYKYAMTKVEMPDNFSKFVCDMQAQDVETIDVEFEEPLARELKSFTARINGDNSMYLVDPVEARDALSMALKAVDLCKI